MSDDRVDDRDWISRIEALREQGAIGEEEESALIRHLAERRANLEAAMAALVPEYRQRLADDGKPAADEWAAAQARGLGEADARATRELLEGMGVALS